MKELRRKEERQKPDLEKIFSSQGPNSRNDVQNLPAWRTDSINIHPMWAYKEKDFSIIFDSRLELSDLHF